MNRQVMTWLMIFVLSLTLFCCGLAVDKHGSALGAILFACGSVLMVYFKWTDEK
jgi:hypothetical protein